MPNSTARSASGFILLGLPLVAILASCDSLFGPDEPSIEGLWISHTGVVVALEEQVQFTALYQRDELAAIDTATGGRWSTTDPSVLESVGEGEFRAVGQGEATVRVEFEGSADEAGVVVRSGDEAPEHRWLKVAVGPWTTCALDTEGRAYCWGMDYFATLGDGERRQWTQTVAPRAVAGGERFVELAMGGHHVCARSEAGTVSCWGIGSFGTGEEPDGHLLKPRPVAGGHDFRTIQSGSGHACGSVTDGATYCWGDNNHGQIGDGAVGMSEYRFEPQRVDGPVEFEDLALGRSFSCARASDARIHCWGGNQRGALALGDEGDAVHPTPTVAAEGREFSDVAAGDEFACGIDLEGEVLCWGANASHQVGSPSPGPHFSPTPLEISAPIDRLALGRATACGLDPDGGAHCWGSNQHGQLATTDAGDPWTPVPVAESLDFATLSVGEVAACGVTSAGALYCWGSNERGQLGTGRIGGESVTPRRVADPF